MVAPIFDLLNLAAVLLLFDGTQRLSTGEKRRQTRWILAVGASLCALNGAGAFYYGHFLDGVVALYESPAFQNPVNPKGLPNIPPDQLGPFTMRDAALTFQLSGVLLRYYDQRNDAWRQWNPSQQQLADREEVVTTHAILRTQSQYAYSAAYATWLFGAVSALVGWCLGRDAWGRLTARSTGRADL
jgi:hypothetical protein